MLGLEEQILVNLQNLNFYKYNVVFKKSLIQNL